MYPAVIFCVSKSPGWIVWHLLKPKIRRLLLQIKKWHHISMYYEIQIPLLKTVFLSFQHPINEFTIKQKLLRLSISIEKEKT